MPSIPITYADLEIRVLELSDERYPVEITFSGEQEFPRGYLKRDIVPWVPSAAPTEDGERLFELLFADDRLKRAWAAARGQSPALRIRLRIDASAPELHAIPWELLRESGSGLVTETLSADADTPFSRYMAGQWRPLKPVVGRPIKMLVAIAGPANLADYHLNDIDVEAERQNLKAAIADLDAGQLAVTFLEGPVTLSALEAELKQGYHILHIVAHGLYNRQRGHAVLFLADDKNRVMHVGEDDFAEMLLRQGEALRLVFLASCQTATRSPAGAFRGFAPKLVAAGVPAVVAMQDLVPVEAARTFAATFYRRLLRHGLVDVAVNEARSAMLTVGLSSSWAVPVLFSRVPEGAILAPRPAPESLMDRLRRIPAVARALAIGSALLGLLSVLAMMLGLFGDVGQARQPGGLLYPLWPAPTATPVPLPPMPSSGFNIAVAQFSMLDATGHLTSTAESQDLSKGIFDAIDKETKELPSWLGVNLQGPDDIGMIDDTDPIARAANAAQVAIRHNATILIYGVITSDDTGYMVTPEFYISDPGFPYGSEVAGPNRLGLPVPYTPPLSDRGTQIEINRKLNARIRALRSLVAGLTYFYASKYDLASASFREAAAVEDWAPQEGKEVVYMLMGAAKLRAYDREIDADRRKQDLADATDAFSQTYQMNHNYVRNYLGLGTVALVPAALSKPIEPAMLTEASKWFSASLNARDQPASAYIRVKAAFGLGQVHLKGFQQNQHGWSKEQSHDFFTQVTTAYDAEPVPDLIWFAGHAHAGLGRLAGYDNDWKTMSNEFLRAIDILSETRVARPNNWIARYWAWVGIAEVKQNHLEGARAAYGKAVRLGTNTVPSDELKEWQTALSELEKGAP